MARPSTILLADLSLLLPRVQSADDSGHRFVMVSPQDGDEDGEHLD